MKVRAPSLGPFAARCVGVVCAAVFVTSAPPVVQAAGVVGTGTAVSCTDGALNTALAGGGLVTFNCGPAAVTIRIYPDGGTGTKTISADTAIDGGSLITISGGSRVGVFSVNTGVTLTVQNLTIAYGNRRDFGYGSVFNNGGTVTVTNSIFFGNYGSAIYINDEGAVTVTSSTFSTGQGSGISTDHGSVTVTDSTFSGNTGGGISINQGTATVTNSTFSGNMGRGISTDHGTVTVTNSTFSGNTGGGISINQGTATVTDSTFSGNHMFDHGGGIANDSGTVTVTNSTFSGNTASGCVFRAVPRVIPGICPSGGGIFSNGALAVINSTFSGNSASLGGGIANDFSGTGTVTNSTFVGDIGGYSGEIFNGGTLTVTNTIFANSTLRDGCFGPITDGGRNLDSGTSCGFSTANGSLSNANPQLDPAGLQDNGGPTQTVALCAAVGVPTGCTAPSPAIGAGDQAVCAAAPVSGLDQRGFVRPGTGHPQCSIGAYEADASAPEACIGDCSGTQTVAINDIITLVDIALGGTEPSACSQGVPSGTDVTVAVIIQAVIDALNGCSATFEHFTDNRDGTITDTRNGLVWEKKVKLDGTSDFANLQDADNSYPWAGLCSMNTRKYCQPTSAAATACALGAEGDTTGCAECTTEEGVCDTSTLAFSGDANSTVWTWLVALNAANFGTRNDWRLAKRSELDGIVDYTNGAWPAVNVAFHGASCGEACRDVTSALCSCTQPYSYWSSTTYSINSTSAWIVSFIDGSAQENGKVAPLYVRAVRGGA